MNQKTNKLVLGTAQMGIPYGISNTAGQISFTESLEILDHAFGSGISILDSAETYGDAHKIIGEFHRSDPSRQFKVITKFAHDFEMGELNQKIDQYLKDLHVDVIDTIMFQSYRNYQTNKDKTGKIAELKAQGVIEKIGVCIYTNEQFEEVIADPLIELIQIPFNILDNWNLRGELIQKARQKNKIIHTRSAFLQGLFFMDRNSDYSTMKMLRKELELADEIAKKFNLTFVELALNYCIQQEQINDVLVGINSLRQLKSNLDSIKMLDEQVIDEINKIKITNFDVLNPSLWK